MLFFLGRFDEGNDKWLAEEMGWRLLDYLAKALAVLKREEGIGSGEKGSGCPDLLF